MRSGNVVWGSPGSWLSGDGGGGRQCVPTHCWVSGQKEGKRCRVRGPWQRSNSWRLNVHSAFQLSTHSGHGHTAFTLTSQLRTTACVFPPPLLSYPFILLLTPPPPLLYFGNGFITAKTEMFQNWFVKAPGWVCDQPTSGRLLQLCF